MRDEAHEFAEALESTLRAGWPDAPCGALLLSDGYEATATKARDRRWPVRRLDAGNHFFMLVEPDTVARELLALRHDVVAATDARGERPPTIG